VTGAPRLVVAAAVLREGRLLIAARAHPPELAGQWEFPGGSVEPGETPEQALVRECREELSLAVIPVTRLLPESDLGGGRRLRLYGCLMVGPAPVPHEHLALRWVDLDASGEPTLAEGEQAPDWVPADRVLVAAAARWAQRNRPSG
jgi:8-oxo-dGTP diphosphatase